MPALFSENSALMRGLTVLANVMILNLVFIATALPLVTLGAALTALNFTAMRLADDECGSVTGDYFRSFRANFRQSTIAAGLLAGFAAVLAAWYLVLGGLAIDPVAEFVLLIAWYVVAFNFATTFLFVFPYLARFEGRTRAVLRNARLLSWKHPVTALAAFCLTALAGLVTVFVPQATGYGLFWLLFGFAGIAFANGHLFNRIFRIYAAPAADQ